MKKLADVPLTLITHCRKCKRYRLTFLPDFVCKECRGGT